MRLLAPLALASLLSAGCAADQETQAPAGPTCPDDSGTETEACNGSAALCDLRYDEVSFAATHNSMSNADAGWTFPNQTHGIAQQLEDGVRGLMLDTHEYEGEAYLCHGVCELGRTPLVEGLGAIRSFLDCHPREIVTIVFESYISAEQTRQAFEDSGLAPYARPQALGEPWPTLRELAALGQRLVVLTDGEAGDPAWLLDQFAYAWQNPYAAKTPEDLSCDVDRGSKDNPVFIMNHFLTAPLASAELAEQVNHEPFFGDHVRDCQTQSGKIPNLVTVDFYDIGDVFSVVADVNGL